MGTMIKDKLEYQVTQEWIEKFKKTLAMMEQDEERKRKDFPKWELSRNALESHVAKLKAEIAEYERLMSCDSSQPIEIIVDNLTDLPLALIKARLAAKISTKELAEIMGIDEERIKQCEDNNYQCASFLELLEVSAALGVEFKTAVMQVDFAEIEMGKRLAKKRQQRISKKAIKIS